MNRVHRIGGRAIFALAIFAVLAVAILTRPQKTLTEFDQPQYFTVASDVMHYGVFSNGWFADNEPTGAPKPGMFYGPLYPWMIVALAKADPRFATAVDCGADMWRGKRPYGSCEVYLWPMLLIHALLLTLGALAVARAAELLFGGERFFWVTGAVTAAALTAEANQFSFVMTEATTFALYSLTMLAMVLGWTRSNPRYFLLAGLGLGLLCLTRFSFLVVALVLPLLIVINARFVVRPGLGRDRRARLRLGIHGRHPAVGRAQCGLGGEIRTDRGIRCARAGRAFRLRPDDPARIRAGIPLLPAGSRSTNRQRNVRAAGDGSLRLRKQGQLLRHRLDQEIRLDRAIQAARSDHRAVVPGGTARERVALHPGQHSARLVRHVGGRMARPVAGADVRRRLRCRLATIAAPAAALRAARIGDARPARRARQLLHALQPRPDRTILGCGRLADRVGWRARAFAIASASPP